MMVTATATALAPNRTAVELVTTLSLTGRPAQFGRGVMVDVGNKLIGQFADCVSNKLGGHAAGGAELIDVVNPDEVAAEVVGSERAVAAGCAAARPRPPASADAAGQRAAEHHVHRRRARAQARPAHRPRDRRPRPAGQAAASRASARSAPRSSGGLPPRLDRRSIRSRRGAAASASSSSRSDDGTLSPILSNHSWISGISAAHSSRSTRSAAADLLGGHVEPVDVERLAAWARGRSASPRRRPCPPAAPRPT